MEQGLQPQMVRPQLYISSMRTELYRDVLESNGITHILQVGIELQPSHPQHFQYLQLPIADWPEQDIVSSFPAAFNFIDAGMDGGGGVLVHCQAGISRSASFVIAYCMWKERLSADAATAVVSAARSAIFPNMGFKTQLREFERLGWDASRWQGWSMSQFLATRYGGESVDFMAAMLGGAPETSGVVRGSSRGQQQPAASTADMYGQPAPVAESPFAQYRAAISKANGSGSSSGPRGSTQQRAYQPQKAAAADSLRSRGCSADQRPGSRGSSKSPALASGSPEVRSARASWSDAASNAPSSRQGPSSTRRASHACYCGKCGVAGGGAAEAGSSSGRRQRRHSTGQQYAQLAAAAGAAAMTHMSLMSLSARTRLPEEAALLMAG